MARSELLLGRGRSAAYVALTAVWLGLLVAGLAEIGLRLNWTPPSALTTPGFGPHPLYGSSPLPLVRGRQVTDEYDVLFEHNDLGFRGPLPPLGPKGEQSRLLVLGDSQTYGLGCNEGRTFVDVLRGALAGVEVLNTGCNAYGTRAPLAIVHHLGEAWGPDVALLVFFWNDLEDNAKRDAPAFALDAAGRVRRTDGPSEEVDALAPLPPVASEPRAPSGPYLARFVKESLRGLRYRLFGIKRRSIRTEEQKRAAWEVTSELLALLNKRCQELDCQLVVASLPDHEEVDPEAHIKNIEPLNFAVRDELFRVCSELGVPTVDLLPPLSASHASGGEPLYYFADRHLTEAGARVVGAALAKDLRGFTLGQEADAPR